ncbi:unnamed protein product [Musa banksii]
MRDDTIDLFYINPYCDEHTWTCTCLSRAMHVTLQSPSSKRRVIEGEAVLLGHVILFALRRRWLRGFFRVASSAMEIEVESVGENGEEERREREMEEGRRTSSFPLIILLHGGGGCVASSGLQAQRWRSRLSRWEKTERERERDGRGTKNIIVPSYHPSPRRRWLRGFFRVASSAMETEVESVGRKRRERERDGRGTKNIIVPSYHPSPRRRWLRGFFRVASSAMEIEVESAGENGERERERWKRDEEHHRSLLSSFSSNRKRA